MDGDTTPTEEASSSGLNNGTTMATSEETAEAAVSQSDSENKDPSSNARPEELYKSKRGRPSKHFLRNKYKKYINRKYVSSLKPFLLCCSTRVHSLEAHILFVLLLFIQSLLQVHQATPETPQLLDLRLPLPHSRRSALPCGLSRRQ